jgi:hypothetical protein
VLVPQSETWVSEFIDPPLGGERRVVGVAASADGRVWAYTQDEQSLDEADERLAIVAADGASAVVLSAADLGLTGGHAAAFAASENTFVLSRETAGADPFIVSEYGLDADLVCASAADSILPFRLVPTPGGDWAMLGYAVPSIEVVFAYLGPACGVAGAWVALQLHAGDEVVALEALDDAFLVAGRRSDGRALVAVFETDGTERWAWTTDEGPGADQVLWAARRPNGWLKVGGIMDAEAGNSAFLLDADPSNGDVILTTFETLVQQPSELNDVRAAFGRSDEWLVFAAGGRYVVQLTDNEPCCPEMIEASQQRPIASQRVGDDLILAVGDDPEGYDDVRITRFSPL